MFSRSFLTITAAFLFCNHAAAQTYTSCNPLDSTSCPEDTALGRAINIDFTKGSVNSFTASGNPTYDSDGVSFTVAKSGDAPQLTSLFYIMFGKVEVTIKAAPGAGIVSSFVLQSDDLDEIDLEWLGADGTEVQTNYFGKGNVSTYNRGEFNPAANNQAEFITYTVEWTSTQITWSVGGTIVRVLTPATADTDQYPQTPMQVKFGAWSGGDPSNAAGTIAWARGPTDYADGPFTMVVKSLAVTDYSTGTQYKYGDTSGSWESIEAVGGQINGNLDGAATSVATAAVSAATSASPSIPAGLGGSSKSISSAETGWPWVASSTTLSTATTSYTSSAGVPSGWIITSDGKVVPATSAATLPLSTPYSSALRSSSSSSLPSLAGPSLEIITGWDDRGFPTIRTEISGWETMSKSYNQQGFLITDTPSPTPIAAMTATTSEGAAISSLGAGVNFEYNGKVVGTSTSEAGAAKQTCGAWHDVAIFGLAAALSTRWLL